MNVAKIRFRPLTGIMHQGDEHLPVALGMLGDISPDLVVAAGVAMFIPQPPEDLVKLMVELLQNNMARQRQVGQWA